jgi:hypothetical protein
MGAQGRQQAGIGDWKLEIEDWRLKVVGQVVVANESIFWSYYSV